MAGAAADRAAAAASKSSSTARASTARPIRRSPPPAAWRCGPRPTASRVSTISESDFLRRPSCNTISHPLLPPLDPERHHAAPDREPLREQLRRRAAPPERDHRGARGARPRDDAGRCHQPAEARRERPRSIRRCCTSSTSPAWAATAAPCPTPMAEALARDFGSVDRWRREFMALADALAGGSGWVLLTYVPRDGRLINQSGADHSQGIAGGIPILALDMYEHAYHLDFGANADRLCRGLHAQHRLERGAGPLRGRDSRCRRRGRSSRSSSPTCRRSASRR